MDPALKQEILWIINEGQDLTLATVREDGYPQATTVSYASDGLAIYFGCGLESQKARNIARNDKISATIDLPYSDWSQIRGLSIGGRARQLSSPEEVAPAAAAFVRKYPQVAQFMSDMGAEAAFYRIEPDVISVLDYRKGFGHTDLVRVDELQASA